VGQKYQIPDYAIVVETTLNLKDIYVMNVKIILNNLKQKDLIVVLVERI
jgi:hypothetical protein